MDPILSILDEMKNVNEKLPKTEQEENEDVSSSNQIETLEALMLELKLEIDGYKGISFKFQYFNKQNE